MGRTKFYVKETNVCDLVYACGDSVVTTLKCRSITLKLHKKKCDICRNIDYHIKDINGIDPNSIHYKKNIDSINNNNIRHLHFTKNNIDL